MQQPPQIANFYKSMVQGMCVLHSGSMHSQSSIVDFLDVITSLQNPEEHPQNEKEALSFHLEVYFIPNKVAAMTFISFPERNPV
jgi:hypothetical protein